LVRAHFGAEPVRFFTTALQVAAHEAQQGHGELAREIRGLVDRARADKRWPVILQFPPELQGLLKTEQPSVSLATLVVPDTLGDHIERILHEYRQQERRTPVICGP